MAKEIEKLSDAEIRRWVKTGQPVAVSDGGGLTFTLSAAGTAAWVLRYRFAGKPRELTLGRYPDVSLKAARERARDERASIQRGTDVARERRREKIEAAVAKSFAELAADYMEKVFPSLAATTVKQRRLRTFALALARVQRRLRLQLPPRLSSPPLRQLCRRPK